MLQETYTKLGQKDVAKNLVSYGMATRSPNKSKKFYGDLLAKALVTKHNWIGIYLTPDKFHPADGDSEHTFATDRVIKKCLYAGIPVSYTVIDYNPLDKSHEKFQALFPFKQRKLNVIDLKAMDFVEFGFGLSRGGMHTWLFSKGYVYEVHWDKVGSELYDKTRITDFQWQSNLIVVPPDAQGLLTMSAASCQ